MFWRAGHRRTGRKRTQAGGLRRAITATIVPSVPETAGRQQGLRRQMSQSDARLVPAEHTTAPHGGGPKHGN